MDPSPTALDLGRPLPAAVRIIARTRDIILVDLPSLPTHPVTVTRTAIILDQDADMRIFDVLFALHARNRNIRANVIGLAESQGRISTFYGDPETLDRARCALQDAATAALWPYDNWRADQFILVPLRDGAVDRDQLEARHLLRSVPERYSLGLVQP
jgi:hypothetical protein